MARLNVASAVLLSLYFLWFYVLGRGFYGDLDSSFAEWIIETTETILGQPSADKALSETMALFQARAFLLGAVEIVVFGLGFMLSGRGIFRLPDNGEFLKSKPEVTALTLGLFFVLFVYVLFGVPNSCAYQECDLRKERAGLGLIYFLHLILLFLVPVLLSYVLRLIRFQRTEY
ncbi:hypothetical protein Plav_0655 [Parvibaculum lavamentivorans DS-1]|uniref:Transmembrane protein n=1 Tax=Parvibaculum lavamentivorans (strain DS-1 / DSM 13023 / NCIMB 13966) TaxID=402881 RepID=A7HQU5_PARL1|nr:hypothetical protein [Parvibaculum lavamentivorans]ABS62278.1 hypothetical protein Plav_0655 [Parvibaculum lavamentivorans DS-1]